MDLKHTFAVPAAPQVAWDTFMDLAGVAQCFPGATVTSFDGSRFEGSVKVKLGPIALMYAGSGTFVERDDAAHRAVISANGKDKRGNGTAGATVTIALAPDGEGTTVDVTTDLSVTGKPAQFGRGVMQDVSDKLLQQFVGCLEQRLTAEPQGGDDAGAPSGGGAAAEGGAAAQGGAAAEGGAADSTEPDAATGGKGPSVPSASAGSARPGTSPSSPTGAVPASAAPAAVRPATPPTRPAAPPGASSEDALDLGATVLPVVLRSFAPQIIAGVVGVLLGILIGRGMRRR